jgi:hypothetical protein
MRVKTNCDTCGPVALAPHDFTVTTGEGSGAEGLFECPVCTRVGALPLDKHAVTVLVARGARESRPATGGLAPLDLADLRRFQDLLDDDEAWSELLAGEL